jgi:glycosyltransferase involved in cell wall biosynthesis
MISLAMLVLDPPLDRLAMLLDYVSPVVGQVVIVVDDRTAPEVCERIAGLGCQCADGSVTAMFRWRNDFAAARNAALEYVHGDWILHLDPDELPSADMLAFLGMVDRSEWHDETWQGATYEAPRGYLFWTRGYVDGQRGSEVEADWHCRLFRASAGRWVKPVHEQVELEGRPESATRGTPWLPKAPRGAYLIHSKTSARQDADLALYHSMEAV